MHASYDAIVIGSGVGGCCAAALLAREGLRVLLAEKRSRLGGRFSTSDHQGYLCADGGLAVQVGGPIEKVCVELGIESGVRPAGRSAYWIDGRCFEIGSGGGGLRKTLGQIATSEDEATRVLGALSDAMNWLEPSNSITFRDWLGQFTDNPRIHGIFQSTIASLLTLNANELPAGEYFRLIKTVAPLRFGYVEGGSTRLWGRMADYIRGHGGEVLTTCPAEGIVVEAGRVRGVRFRHGQEDLVVDAPLVVSNLGPSATVVLAGREHFERSYLEHLDVSVRPTAILWIHFASDEAIFEYSALAVCGTRRVNMLDVPSLDCAGLAPSGKHLYTVGAAPLDTSDPGDVDAEFACVLADLRDMIPGFDQRCRILTRTCYRGKWPGFRTRPGQALPLRTSVRGLFNVGDAVCAPGHAGSMGAADSAMRAREDILRLRSQAGQGDRLGQ
jgi:phytoene desaturase